MTNEGIAAWIVCEDLLVKVKAELANEAIITLQKEVKAGRMKVTGNLVSTEIQNDAERDLFVANEIASESTAMLQGYADYIKQKESSPGKLTADDVVKIENSKRLMLAVQEISLLIRYRVVTEEWILEIEGMPKEKEPVKLLTHTIHGTEDERFSVLDFILRRKSIKEEKIFNDEERGMMEAALVAVDPTYKLA